MMNSFKTQTVEALNLFFFLLDDKTLVIAQLFTLILFISHNCSL